MPNINIFRSLPDDKVIAAMQQPENLQVPSKSDFQDSSLLPCHQENQSKIYPNHHQQDQEHEQEKLQEGSRRKRKWESDDEASLVETPRKNIRNCCPPRPPRKPKATPAMKGRAKWLKRSVVFMDVAKEVETMFPPSVLQDFGKKIKKAKS